NGVDQELGPDPGADSLQSSHPCWQRRQAAAERGGVAIRLLDGDALLVQPLAEGATHQRDAPQALRTLVMVPRSRRAFRRGRNHQLIAALPSLIEQSVAVITAISQHVAAVWQLPEQSGGDRFFAL